jgi:trk system potassium uptake protein TrkH
VAAYFEAASGFTTTGATVLTKLGELPSSIIVWRALLQWIGGLATLVSLAALLGPLSGSVMLDRQLRLVGHSTHGTTLHMKEAVRSILPLYGALTAACFVALSISGIPAFDAFCLSLSTVSTGGFMPRDGTIVLYGAPLAEFTLALFMTLGAVSIIWVRAILQMRWPIVRELREPVWIFRFVGVTGIILAVALALRNGDYSVSTLLHSLTLGLASAASIISTTGFAISEQTHVFVPYVVLLSLCLIGGGRFSTAGGLKVYRIVAMLRQFNREFRLLVYPHGVRPSRHAAETLDVDVVKSIWISLTALVLVVGVVALTVSWAGVPFGGALMAAAGSVSNFGPAYDFARSVDYPTAPAYAEMTTAAQLALSAGMIFGRMEILALLTFLNVVFWRD